MANDLARIYMNKAIAVGDLGLHGQAEKLYDLAIEIQERLVHKEGRLELAEDLAKAYANKALSESSVGNDEAAERLRGLASEIRARLVHHRERQLGVHVPGAYVPDVCVGWPMGYHGDWDDKQDFL